MHRDLVVVCWDGKSAPLQAVNFDHDPRFDLLAFDYSGRSTGTEIPNIGRLLSRRTEGKGQVCQEVVAYLQACGRSYDYVGIIDDDIIIKISDINHMLHIARLLNLDAFQPSLSHDSASSHNLTRHRENIILHWVPWIEIMTPFYRVPLFMAGAPFYGHSWSSWGIDCFVMPMVQKITNMTRAAVINAVMASHMRPLSGGGKVQSNGLTALQEMAQICRVCMNYVREKHPEWVETDWFRQTFEQRYRRLAGAPLA